MASFTPHWYGGAAISRSSYSGATSVNGSIVEPNHGTGGKLFVGYRFNPHVAVEASGIDMGSASSMKGEGGSLDVLGIAPVNSSINLFAKAGIADMKAQGTDHSGYKSGLNYGVGGTYLISNKWSARLEAERFQKVGDQLKGNLYSLGVQYGF
ncbi:MAG: porin family protein [Pseudomonadota bacterium]|nr:porin family protein [Pseudomonadota bacterium]